MTINEFRAWLDGFKEAVGDAPTPDQWAKVLAKLGEVREPMSISPNLPNIIGPNLPNIIGPYWSPSIPPNVPNWPAVTCGGTSAELPGWLKAVTLLSNMRPLDATASAAIFVDVEPLYEN